MTENQITGKLEAGCLGKQYERKILMWISLKCLLEERIKDFWLLSNPKKVDKFDDIILHVEYENGEKEMFFLQLKHKEKGGQFRASMLQSSKHFKLEQYEKDYLKITKDENSFLRDVDVDVENTKMFFIIGCNRQLWLDPQPDYSRSQLERTSESQEKPFLNCSSNPTIVACKVNSEKYDTSFLNDFYIHCDLFMENEVEEAICEKFGLKPDLVKSLVNDFVKTFEPSDNMKKVYKFDIQIKLLRLIFDNNFHPPALLPPSQNKKDILGVVKSFNVSLITKESSEAIIWNEIWQEMEAFCEVPVLDRINWDTPVPDDLKEKLSHIFKATSSKHYPILREVFLYMVAKGIIFYYQTTASSSFAAFERTFVSKLATSTVIYDKTGRTMRFPECTSVFENLGDIKQEALDNFENGMLVSLQGKSQVDLLSIIKSDLKVRKKITTDCFFGLLNESIDIGKVSEVPEYYVKRKLKVIKQLPKNEKEDWEEKSVFIICNFKKRNHRKYHNSSLEKCVQLMNKVNTAPEYVKLIDKDIRSSNTVIRHNVFCFSKMFSAEMLNYIKDSGMTKASNLYIFEYDPDNRDSERWFLKYAEGPLDYVQQFIEHDTEDDTNLVKRCKDFPANIICNNAGMGKTFLLKYISNQFSPENWVIHMDLTKSRGIEKAQNLNQLLRFFHHCEIKSVDEKFLEIHNILYEYFEVERKFVWLIDDYEAMHTPILSNLLKEACDGGMRIWIVARPHVKFELETSLKSFSMELMNFEDTDLEYFFEKYSSSKETKTRGDMIAFKSAINLLKDSFIGNCQKAMMIAEIFEYEIKQYESVHEIYERFIELKINKYPEHHRVIVLRAISKLALSHLFSENTLRTILEWDEYVDDVKFFDQENRKGFIIVGFSENDMPIFSHQTYAEFLVARWLVDKVKKQKEGDTLIDLRNVIKMLYIEELSTTRSFFDSMLRHNRSSAVSNNCFLTENDEETDQLGRSIYHLFMGLDSRFEIHNRREVESYLQCVTNEHATMEEKGGNIILNVPKKSPSDSQVSKFPHERLSDVFSVKDTFLDLDVLNYALLSGSLVSLNHILANKLAVLPDLEKDKMYFILVHSIVHRFDNIIGRLELKNLNCTKVKVQNYCNMSLLHLAVRHNNPLAVNKLIEIESSLVVWGLDDYKNTVLHVASNRKFNNRSIRILFDRGENMSDFGNMKNRNGHTHLHCLAARGHVRWAERLLNESNVKIDDPCNKGNTPFMTSFKHGYFKTANLLKNRGADVNYADKKGLTILHHAAMRGKLTYCKNLIMKHNADVNITNRYGSTPLILAVRRGREDVVEFLANYGEINQSDNREWTALHHAVKRERANIIKILLEKGAHSYRLNDRKMSPLRMASHYNLPEITKVLLDGMANRINGLMKIMRVLKYLFQFRQVAIAKESKQIREAEQQLNDIFDVIKLRMDFEKLDSLVVPDIGSQQLQDVLKTAAKQEWADNPQIEILVNSKIEQLIKWMSQVKMIGGSAADSNVAFGLQNAVTSQSKLFLSKDVRAVHAVMSELFLSQDVDDFIQDAHKTATLKGHAECANAIEIFSRMFGKEK